VQSENASCFYKACAASQARIKRAIQELFKLLVAVVVFSV
jgi:ribosomal protein L23